MNKQCRNLHYEYLLLLYTKSDIIADELIYTIFLPGAQPVFPLEDHVPADFKVPFIFFHGDEETD